MEVLLGFWKLKGFQSKGKGDSTLQQIRIVFSARKDRLVPDL